MSDLCKVAATLFAFWIGAMLIVFGAGLSEANERPNACDQRWAPIEYVVPGFRLGCFLGYRPPPQMDRENPPKQDEGK